MSYVWRTFTYVHLRSFAITCCNPLYKPIITLSVTNPSGCNWKCYKSKTLSYAFDHWMYLLLHICCPRRTKFVRGLWNGLRTVCVSVRPSVNEKCYFSSISWPILILFILSDRAGWGLQNFYTEFWNSLIMQIYANLFFNKMLLLYFLANFDSVCFIW